MASREACLVSLPDPLLSCSSLPGTSHLKRFHGLSPHSCKPLSSQQRENDRREAGSDGPVALAFRLLSNGRDRVSEQSADVPLSRWRRSPPRLFSLSVFSAVPSWLGSHWCSFCGTPPSKLFGSFLHLFAEPLGMPAQILPDRSHPLIAHQFL